MERSPLAARLRELRSIAAEAQIDTADALGVTQGNYSAWETGRRQPDAVNLAKLARHFGVPLDHLMDLIEVETRSMSVSSERPTRAAVEATLPVTRGYLDEALTKALSDSPATRKMDELAEAIRGGLMTLVTESVGGMHRTVGELLDIQEMRTVAVDQLVAGVQRNEARLETALAQLAELSELVQQTTGADSAPVGRGPVGRPGATKSTAGTTRAR